MNSLRSLERAIDYEIKRQSSAIENGESIIQETRHWDESKETTTSMRSKEGSADYRYFSDPDLPFVKTFVESQTIARMSLVFDLSSLKSIAFPTTGSSSIFQSPV